MGVQNGGQWSGLRRRGAPVKTQAGKVTGDAIADRPPGRVWETQARCRTQPDDWPTSQESFLFPIEVTASAGDNYPAHNRPIFWQLLVSILGSGEIPFSG